MRHQKQIILYYTSDKVLPDPVNFSVEKLFVRTTPEGATQPDDNRASAKDLLFRPWQLISWLSGQKSKRSLIDLLYECRYVSLQPTSAGFEPVDVPFPHVIVFFDHVDEEFRRMAQQKATADLEKYFSGLVDDMVGLRMRAFDSDKLPGGAARAFLGAGIFAPEVNDEPLGTIMIRDEASAQPLRLPDGSPAALYRAQASLAFSGNPLLTPAHCSVMKDLPGCLMLEPARLSEKQRPCSLTWSDLGDADATGPSLRRLEPASTDIDTTSKPLPDARFSAEYSDGRRLTIEVTLDNRPSRLLRQQPVTPALAIVGVLAPTLKNGRAPSRWWIDLDDDARLCSHAMTPARWSLVCEQDKLEVWDWLQPARHGRPYALGSVNLTSLSDRQVMCTASTAPFGWLAVPNTTINPVFLFGAPLGSFALDWLDFSGAVEATRRSAGTRLAQWFATDPAVATPIPGKDPGPLAREVLHVASEQQLATGWPGKLSVGTRFLSGGLLLEYVEAAS